MILMIDNYDSFVFNIYQYVLETTGEEIVCKRNDEITLEAIKFLSPSKIILSPGPKHPKDSGICLEILKANLGIPILGVCLGHQAIGLSFGAKIKTLEVPKHGKTSEISVVSENAVLAGLPSKFEVMRYHSLYVDELPPCLEISAVSEDGVIMAMKHKEREIYGIQFHPESYFTQYGKKIIENFVNLNKPQIKEKKVSNFAPFMIKLQKGFPLEGGDYEEIFSAVMAKDYDIVQLAGLLVLISEKSLYPDSLSALVRSVLKYSKTYSDDNAMLDIVGTGGDALKTINISTTCAFILASLGVRVGKHGNSAVSSKSGSSNIFEALGVPLNSDLGELRALMDKTNLAFFHAPFFHKVTAEVKEARTRLKIGTFFNILGPLLNPNLTLSNQVVGNYHEEVNELIAQTLQKLGRKHALVVHGMDGMDEITLCDETLVHEVRGEKIIEYKITPEQFGFNRAFHTDIEGGDSKFNAEIFKSTIKGELKGPKRDIVVLNAMFALYAADFAKSPTQAKEIIENALDSGKVWGFYQNYIKNFG
ncbi:MULTISPECIES: anthranilate phosphoribosyltransferase [unclassified Campylobacter]|uniref:anthranilate phosphoribosyltransferase n=1 Tax=unclassified Campylobacter TaxID=2593542 RepID=UPI0022E9A453|nr:MULTISPECIES: anthranilate phosphoribosyltransferase [unclassified Campylobacter]MDA3043374.1 anthranilate phosphoribosyltransferase [Campylobacter sp. JMF_09 ED2]MDA3045127.1 anthranilate phosphoribosyltransferase [Campylobacter sp. JMF_07 ED4]MDA3064273.1 anthranilate phosphoribosyltransferase [Campylobacter sp. JMF_11 EL3]MDA3072427.1 anthranilate phosphoribosyltransferase [Campylobacter sp. VBCF_03 NA9]MDA3075461.1 anthranilate phosphoribosyltransferase [Campylobacter sp. JMF_05 ED3]